MTHGPEALGGDMEFEGKTVLISGGGSGVGADMARAFAAKGATVWIGGRRAGKLDTVAASAPGIRPHVLDVTDEASVVGFFDAAGKADIVIANAGIVDSNPLAKVDAEAWTRMIATNLTGVFLTYREAARRMTGGWGRILSVASIAGVKGLAYAAHYAAAKHGVVGLTRSLALELAPKGVTVNAICPGYLDTDMTSAAVEGISARSGRPIEDAQTAVTSLNPMKRLIRPDEVTATALFLASDGASSVNGQAVVISGGDP